jgi:mRNA interferase MazF
MAAMRRDSNGRVEISLSDIPGPIRGEVWLVSFDPTIGAEIRKTRPAIVVSSDGVGKLPIKLVAPITEWKDAFGDSAWLVRIDPDSQNGLSKTSTADTLQLRGMDLRRFVSRLGQISPQLMEEIAAAIAIVVEYR